MRKALRILLYLVAVLLVAVLGMAAYINWGGEPTFEAVPVPDLQVEMDSASIANGYKLVTSGCQGCHGGPSGKLEGVRFEDEAANQAFGEYYTANITKHPTEGIGSYTDGELYRLLRTGIKKDHTLASVVMPKWVLVPDEDIEDIIAFLRSDHPLVQASDEAHPVHQPTFLEKALKKFAFQPHPLKDAYPKPVSLADSIAYGKYLVQGVGHCYACHSGSIEEADLDVPENTPGYLRGGYVFLLKDNQIEVPGLLLEEGNHVSDWTIDQFVDAVKYGQRPNLPAYRKPMHPYPALDTAEVRAIYHYLAEYTKNGK